MFAWRNWRLRCESSIPSICLEFVRFTPIVSCPLEVESDDRSAVRCSDRLDSYPRIYLNPVPHDNSSLSRERTMSERNVMDATRWWRKIEIPSSFAGAYGVKRHPTGCIFAKDDRSNDPSGGIQIVLIRLRFSLRFGDGRRDENEVNRLMAAARKAFWRVISATDRTIPFSRPCLTNEA